MPAPLIPPKFRAFTQAGLPLNGGLLYSYAAGTTTPLSTYPTSADAAAATNANANPTVLDANGEANVWLGSSSYKFVLKDSAGVTQWTVDSVSESGVSTAASTTSEWLLYGAAPTYISATSFSVAGDQTATFEISRRLKSAVTAGTTYSTITAATFAAAATTVTVKNTSGTLDSGMSAVYYSLLDANNVSVPQFGGLAMQASNGIAMTSTVEQPINSTNFTITTSGDPLNEFTAADGRYTAKKTGLYTVSVSGYFTITGTVATGLFQVTILKNGSLQGGNYASTGLGGTSVAGFNASCSVSLNATDYITISFKSTFTGTAPSITLSFISIARIS